MSTANSSKAGQGNFFEDFSIGQVLHHATPRTITAGDASLYTALTGSRFILPSSQQAAQSIGHDAALVDDLLVFHIAFGKTGDDVSLNAVANLGYADIRFITPVYIGDSISVSSSVIGLRENRNGKSGIVYVESVARNQHDQTVLRWNRWVWCINVMRNIPPYQARCLSCQNRWRCSIYRRQSSLTIVNFR